MMDNKNQSNYSNKEESKSNFPIKWSAMEHDHPQKTADWYWYVGSGALAVLIFAYLLRNFLFGC